jgi:(4-(4-[2-(gamma-L-glutamylamino)ethyl]phenoxymethyl)furan-2-yl)methanamine synthase
MLGLDIGGANLKAATSAGVSRSVPFPLWKRPGDLAAALEYLVGEFPEERELAATMTGELCDCYASKTEGVLAILAAVAKAANRRGLREPRIWTTAGRFVTLEIALAEPLPAAAANWLALATYAGRLAPNGSALMVDIGSTTTDIIPLVDGQPVPRGRTDPARLASSELVYCGVRRTPLCAVFGLAKAAEFFATTEDVYLALGEFPDEPHRVDTADGRPATRACALARLARMDCDDVGDGHGAMRIAEEARDRLWKHLRDAIEKVSGQLPNRVETIVCAGSGRFLLPDLIAPLTSGTQLRPRIVPVDERISDAACAYAVAVLAEETR